MAGRAVSRWDRLFGDLEAELEQEDRVAFDAEVAELARAEHAALTLADRLRGQTGREVTCRLVEGEPVTGVVRETGAQWVLLERAGELLVPLHAVVAVSGLGATAEPHEDGLLRRLPLTVVLRGLARDRVGVTLTIRGGAGGTVLQGTIDRVGADHLDLAEHPLDQPRRAANVRAVHVIPLPALVLVRTR